MTKYKSEEEATWKLARELAWEVYGITSRESFGGDHRVKNNIRRASFAIMANVAESFERSGSENEFSRYLGRARHEVGELRVQLDKAQLQCYINADVVKRLELLMDELGCMISGLMATVSGSHIIVDSTSGYYQGL